MTGFAGQRLILRRRPAPRLTCGNVNGVRVARVVAAWPVAEVVVEADRAAFDRASAHAVIVARCRWHTDHAGPDFGRGATPKAATLVPLLLGVLGDRPLP